MAALKVGNGLEDGVAVGPLVNASTRDKVDELVKDALAKGAKALTGAKRPDGVGYFYPPTVLTGVKADADLVREEIFGPVAAIQTFRTEDEMVEQANDSEYGLASYVYTQDLSRGLRVAERLEAGMVGLNRGIVSDPAAPFGGVKQSGLGREGGLEGIEEYLYTQYIGIADPYAG
jgi:succinate-semialdehyde dehydrogenase/glutarate-semialdehyde dehydrogenase